MRDRIANDHILPDSSLVSSAKRSDRFSGGLRAAFCAAFIFAIVAMIGKDQPAPDDGHSADVEQHFDFVLNLHLQDAAEITARIVLVQDGIDLQRVEFHLSGQFLDCLDIGGTQAFRGLGDLGCLLAKRATDVSDRSLCGIQVPGFEGDLKIKGVAEVIGLAVMPSCKACAVSEHREELVSPLDCLLRPKAGLPSAEINLSTGAPRSMKIGTTRS